MCFRGGGGQRSMVKDHIFTYFFWDPSLRDIWNFGAGCICDNAYMLLCWNIMFFFQDACSNLCW